MICRYDQLRRHTTVLLKLTGLRIHEFEQLVTDYGGPHVKHTVFASFPYRCLPSP